MKPSIAVVIVTHARTDLLIRCLASLEKAAHTSGSPTPVFIGINGTDPLTSEKMNNSKSAFSHLQLHVRQWKDSLYPGAARNQVLAEMPKEHGAEWIYFIDDDAYLPETGFEPFFDAIASNPDAGILGGPNLTPPEASRFSRLTGQVLASRFATYFSRDRYRKAEVQDHVSESKLILCNLLVKRSALGDTPFPPELPCAEETAYLNWARAQGQNLVYSPELYVFHDRKDDFVSLARQVYKYGNGRGLWILKNRFEMNKIFHFIPTACVLTALGLLVRLAFTGTLPALGLLLFWIYLILLLFFGFQAKGAGGGRDYFTVLGIFVLIHFFYGTGVLNGIFGAIGQRNSQLKDR